jgi:hypothetical protein
MAELKGEVTITTVASSERRMFAAMAMQITVGNVKTRHSDTIGVYLDEKDLKQAARDAVRISDMLIEELNKEETK